jgi:hypothetical protein
MVRPACDQRTSAVDWRYGSWQRNPRHEAQAMDQVHAKTDEASLGLLCLTLHDK